MGMGAAEVFGGKDGGRLAAIAFGACFLLALVFPSLDMAKAAAPPPFWTECNGGLGDVQCSFPRGVVANAAGHLYVADQGNDRIDEYTVWGELVKAWGWGVADESPELQTCGPQATPPTVACQAGIKGGDSGQLIRPQGLAVDSSGDVYVSEGDFSNRRVQKFNAAGEFIWMIGGDVNKTKVEEGAPEAQRNLCTAASGDVCQAATEGSGQGQFGAWVLGSYIAVDPGDGTVYVGDQERIQVFDPGGAYVKSLPLPGEAVQSLAVDPSGDLYVALLNKAQSGLDKENVLKLGPGGESKCIAEVENPRAIAAVDGVGKAYVSESVPKAVPFTRVWRFDSTCGDKEELFAEAEGTNSTGIATSTACDVPEPSIYVSNASALSSFVRAYGFLPNPEECSPPIHPPEIHSQYAASVGAGDAILRAQINPHFWTDTTYYVEYGTAKCTESACAQQPLSPGSTLKGAGVKADVTTSGVVLSGLQPGTIYHYRFVSRSSGGGPVYGVDPDGDEGPEEASFEDGLEATFTTFPLPLDPKVDCPNQGFRGGASAHLPDCRAHEMVSPVDKNNGDISVLTRGSHPVYLAGLEQSASDGDKIAYSSATAFGDALSAPYTSQYIAARKAGDAWLTHAVSPPRGPKSVSNFANVKFDQEYKAFSADLCDGWLLHDSDPILASGAVPGYLNLYRRDNCGEGADGYEAITTVKPPKADAGSAYWPELQGVSEDGSHAFFTAPDKLTPEAPDIAISGSQLYESTGGALRYVCILPDGEASGQPCTLGTFNETNDGRGNTVARAVSADGSRVFWTDKYEGPGPLYVRINPDREQSALENGDECTEPEKACTIAVSVTPARFLTAADDGSRVLYTAEGGKKLFEFEVESQTTRLIAEGAVGVAEASQDGSQVYFASTSVLSGEEENSEGAKAEEGNPNLYLYQAGEEATITYVATLSGEDVAGAQATAGSPLATVTVNPMRRAVRVSPDGRHLAFTSTARLTGYDNTDVGSGKADAEVFLYDAAGGKLTCVSCNPTGARPKGRDFEVGGQPLGSWAAAQIPAWESQLYAPRALSDNGSRLFFESFEALVPRDNNGKQDVYEWERAGSQEECLQGRGAELFVASTGGCLSLISSGQSPADSEFADASPDGRDVFFRTASSLLLQDPGLIDLYDAREEGGLPEPPSPNPPCEGEACQSSPAPPEDPTPSSSSFEDAPNATESQPKPRCPKGKRSVRRNGKARCVPAHKRHSKRAQRHSQGRA
jgi:NHL repeat/WD40-like Beta Propeller Repeat